MLSLGESSQFWHVLAFKKAGLVMSRAGKVLLRCDGDDVFATALLRNGQRLIREAHEAKEADLAHEILEVLPWLPMWGWVD